MARLDGPARMRALQWIVRNKYQHLDRMLAHSTRAEQVTPALRRRLRRRLKSAKRLAEIRAVLYATVYVAAIAPTAAAILNALLPDPFLGGVLGFVLGVMVLIGATIGVLAIAFLTRTLGILEAEIYVLAIEAGLQRAARPAGAPA